MSYPHGHHDHPHDHSHGHPHGHSHGHAHAPVDVDETTAAALDTSVADADLSPAELSRRGLLRAAGIVGGLAAGVAGAVGGAVPAFAHDEKGGPQDRGGDRRVRYWLSGDHHIHTQYSPDAVYRVLDQAQHARAYGLDWIVITDHGGPEHARIGVERVAPDIEDARRELPDLLIYQGLEWNIPSAEHGTVFVAPGRNAVPVLKEFENTYDGRVTGTSNSSPANEALAVQGVQWLGGQIDARRVEDALFLANHPARNGIDSPHEIRAWRDADPRVAVGMEGAPGHQAAGLPYGAADARGYYGNSPNPNSFQGYPLESYRTWGGFDFFTSTVGGLWDSLLAEGKPWWISANSDSHENFAFTATRGPGSDFAANGFYNDPVYQGGLSLEAGDFWPGFYSRTHVGADSVDYRAVMDGIRRGRMWVDHGRLVKTLDVNVRRRGTRSGGDPLGSIVTARRGRALELAVRIEFQDLPNWAGFVPTLNRVDVIRGVVDTAGPSDRDVFVAPDTRVVQSWDTSGRTGIIELVYDLGVVEEAFYVRLRGTDGNRSQPGYLGADKDPDGPAIDVIGDADPWLDLWFYTNPIWVVPQAR